MAFEAAITGRTVFGNKRVHFGTFTNGASDAGGDINTGLRSCEAMILQHIGSAVVASAPTVNETLPIAGTAVTVVTTAGADGHWVAVGY